MSGDGGGGGGGGGGVVGSRYCDGDRERELTVRKTSLFYPGDGFLVYEHHHRAREEQGEEGAGELVFRVDTYGGGHHHGRRDELVLMGPDGSCILTVRKKKASLHHRWEGFPVSADGEDHAANKKPVFSVRRASIIGFGAASPFLVDLESGSAGDLQKQQEESPSPLPSASPSAPTSPRYLVEGSYSDRCCTVYEGNAGDGERRAVVEIGRKVDAAAKVTMGKDVFCLRLSSGFDAAFAMGIVLALDQITADEPHSPGDGPLPNSAP